MVTKRQFREEGHRRKFLAVVDNSPECSKAVKYAARRAAAIGGGLVLVYIIEPGEFQHWLGVEDVMRAEARQEADAALAKFGEFVRENVNLDTDLVIREGQKVAEIEALIQEDRDIAIMVLAAGDSSEGPGPLVSSIAGRTANFPIPVTVVPATLTDEDIDDLV